VTDRHTDRQRDRWTDHATVTSVAIAVSLPVLWFYDVFLVYGVASIAYFIFMTTNSIFFLQLRRSTGTGTTLLNSIQ